MNNHTFNLSISNDRLDITLNSISVVKYINNTETINKYYTNTLLLDKPINKLFAKVFKQFYDSDKYKDDLNTKYHIVSYFIDTLNKVDIHHGEELHNSLEDIGFTYISDKYKTIDTYLFIDEEGKEHIVFYNTNDKFYELKILDSFYQRVYYRINELIKDFMDIYPYAIDTYNRDDTYSSTLATSITLFNPIGANEYVYLAPYSVYGDDFPRLRYISFIKLYDTNACLLDTTCSIDHHKCIDNYNKSIITKVNKYLYRDLECDLPSIKFFNKRDAYSYDSSKLSGHVINETIVPLLNGIMAMLNIEELDSNIFNSSSPQFLNPYILLNHLTKEELKELQVYMDLFKQEGYYEYYLELDYGDYNITDNQLYNRRVASKPIKNDYIELYNSLDKSAIHLHYYTIDRNSAFIDYIIISFTKEGLIVNCLNFRV